MTTSQLIYQVTAYKPTQPMSSRKKQKANRKQLKAIALDCLVYSANLHSHWVNQVWGFKSSGLQAERIEHLS
jgi:hypothetical protein